MFGKTAKNARVPDVVARDDVLADEDFVDEEGEEEAAKLRVVEVLLDQLLRLHELYLPLHTELALDGGGGGAALALAAFALLGLYLDYRLVLSFAKKLEPSL